jgi:sporulation protein YtfJ
MENNKIGELMEITMTKIKEMVDVNTIVGSPITTPDGIVIVPVSKVSFGFASGGSEFSVKEKPSFGGGNGAGVKIEPIGFLVIREGSVRMLNIAPPPGTTLDRVVEMIPGVLDRVEEFIEKRKSDRE